MSAQLQLPALPSADEQAAATAKREAWRRRVLAAARAVEVERGPWWGCRDVAAKLGRSLRRVAPALMVLRMRGSLERGEVGVGPRGRVVFAWTASKSHRNPWQDMEIGELLEKLSESAR